LVKEAFVLLGHGSRRPEANQEILDIAEQVKARAGDGIYRASFFQFGEPGLVETIQQLARAGVEKITVVPLLLVTGNHIKVDLPEILKEQQRRYPGIKFMLAPHLGPDPRIADIVIDRMKQGSEI